MFLSNCAPYFRSLYTILGVTNGTKVLTKIFPGRFSTTKQILGKQIVEGRQKAARVDVVVVFAGLPDSYESEGFDRASLDLPAGHNRLIEAVSTSQLNTIVVLMNGSAVAMPWEEKAKGIVKAWLGELATAI